jgi:ABC-type transporter Mla MlaB component
MSASTIEVSETPGRMHPGVTEAAVCFAAGHVSDARAILEGLVENAPLERRAWWMLMDLARLEGRWQDYDGLALRYREAFGREAPAERDRKSAEAHLPEALRTGGAAAVGLGAVLDTDAVPALARAREAASRHTVVLLDAARLESVDPGGARLLEDTLHQLIATGNGVVIGGADHLLRLLRRACEQSPTQRSYWELSLLLLRMAQDRPGFEKLALEYALAAEVEAPAWEQVIMPQPPAPAATERRAQPRYALPERLELQGTMTGSADPQLASIAGDASGSPYMNIGLSRLERIDFVCAARLANLLSRLADDGKKVRLLNPNHLVAALLELLNLEAVASIIVTRD